jgi:DtxR family Mn-dependent transcriptional regulator
MVASVDSVAGALGLRRWRAAEWLAELDRRGLAGPRGDGWVLTAAGRQAALEVVRKHRLVETWLARETGVPAADWHRAAHAAEHRLGRVAADELADRLGNPRYDPHGDPIPTREGELPVARRVSLGEWPAGVPAIIEHLEDEPESLFREIVRAGLHPGMVLSGIERRGDGGVRVVGEGRRVEVPVGWLGLVHVAEVPAEEAAGLAVRRLSELPVGAGVQVHGLSAACVGAERRRLLDLGLVPGTAIHCEFISPFGSPRAYLVRGSLIALRREQADKVLVVPGAGGWQ